MSDMGNMLRPLANRISNMLVRGVVLLVYSTTKMQSLQMRMLAGEEIDGVEHFEPYGFTSAPHEGAEAAGWFFDGDRSYGIVICVADRRYRLTGLAAGEVALHDDQGQKVHLTRTGIVIDGGGKNLVVQNAPTVTVKAATKVRLETPLVEIAQDLKVGGNVAVTGSVGAASGFTGTGTLSGAGSRSVFNFGVKILNGTEIVNSFTVNGKNVSDTHTHTSAAIGSPTSAVN